jgi:PAS domain S-box-containing protein
MKKEKENHGEPKLRRRAEEKLKEATSATGDFSGMSPEEMANLIHELEVHQVELEMQNEELRRIQGELENSRDGYSHLYDFAPVGYVTISDKGIIMQANLSFASMLGVERSSLIGKPFSRFIFKDDQDAFYFHRKMLFEANAKQVCELKLVRKDRTQFHAHLESIVAKNPQVGIAQMQTTITGINERKLAEEALQKAYDELDLQVKARTAELAETNEELKQEIAERTQAVQNLKDALSEIEVLKDHLEAEKAYLQEEIKQEYNYMNIIGSSDELRYTLYKVEQIAPTDTDVIILGETGTGKELIARAIHASGPLNNRAFVKVNCAALPLNLIESELFGHEKGAFSGAIVRRLGRFEVADGATLFLDEIGELPLELQTKLLRVIQDGEFERLGSSRTIKVNVRIIAATNRNLEKEVRKGRFRDDLWYRLNIFPITVPPLRSRMDDLPLLVDFFIKKISKRLGKTIEIIPASVMNSLQNYHWPGNIRELENVLERAVISSAGDKLRLVDDLKKSLKESTTSQKTLEAVERDHIIQVLEQTRWKVSGKNGASEILGLNSSTLRGRMRKLGIHKP